jgi:hypothetical protein
MFLLYLWRMKKIYLSRETVKSTNPPEKYFTFLGFVIVRKADFLAATAFILAAASSIYQIGGYLWGPHLTMYLPDRVIIAYDHFPDGTVVTRAYGQITFTNSGAEGRSATIKEVHLSLDAGKVHSDQYWFAFSRTKRVGQSLQIDETEQANPVLIPGAATVTKSIGFAPRLDDCSSRECEGKSNLIDDKTFGHELARNLGKNIKLTFSATTFQNGEVTPVSCYVSITDGLILALSMNDWTWARCVPGE